MTNTTRRGLEVKRQPDRADAVRMGPDPSEAPRTSACPSCGAALRPGSPWCTLCYADLRPPPPLPPAAPTAPSPAVSPSQAGDPLTQPLIDFLPKPAVAPPSSALTAAPALPRGVPGEAAWPCTTCGTRNPIEASACVSCGAAFLAEMAGAGRPRLIVPVLGDVGRLTRSQRLLAGLGVVIVVMLLVSVITLLLTDSSQKSPPRPAAPPTAVVVPDATSDPSPDATPSTTP